tara:strand:+ start:7565 stop:8842 length:1278 start_codon:yes stop_codon:yes gene_type:complete
VARGKKAARLNKNQRALLALLRSRSGKTVETGEILKVTGWKQSSWRVYRNNGLYSPYLRDRGDGRFDVLLDDSVDDAAFARQVTQSTRKRRPTGALRYEISRRLVERSADNMILAVETYNRPTLKNRMDGFAMLFCTAWEQLLKAEMIEASGENAAYRPSKPGRRRETLSLDECLQHHFGDKDVVRKNIERIAELRHAATHFVVPEIQAPFAYVFQSGVLNYARRYRDLMQAPFLPRANIGLLALAGQGEEIDAAALQHLYGADLGAEIADYSTQLEDEIAEVSDERFAVRVEVTIRFASDKGGASPDVTLVKASEAPANAVVLYKPTDPERTHPYRTLELCELITQKLGHKFSTYDLQCVLHKTGWKKADNSYHRLQQNPDTHKYSVQAVEEIVRLLTAHDTYLKKAKESYRRTSRSRSKAEPP